MSRTAPLLFLALDVGTSGAKATAVDLDGRVVGHGRRSYGMQSPHPGWVEQDPRDWSERAVEALAQVSRRLEDPSRVAGIALTGQCPTVAPVDARGNPVGAGMLYLDNRATEEAHELATHLPAAEWHRRTGHVPEAFYAGPKILWLRRHRPKVFARARHFVQPRDVVLRRLTGVNATDETHAGTTLFFDLAARRWAADILAAFDLTPDVFPPIMKAYQVAGTLSAAVAEEVGLAPDVPVTIGAADSLCAAYGVGVADPGPISEMAGSSSCLNSSIPCPLEDERITQYRYVMADRYMTELGVNTAGAAISWVARRFAYPSQNALLERARRFRGRLRRSQRTATDPRELAPLFIPYLGDGERDDPDIRGAFAGLSQRHARDAIAFAAVEGVALAVRATIEVLREAGCEFDELRVSGGAARHDVTSQLKADVLNRVVTNVPGDSTAIGTALLAAGAAGFDEDAARALESVLARGTRYAPEPWAVEAEAARAEWFDAVRTSDALRIRRS
jgi:xylulokinase